MQNNIWRDDSSPVLSQTELFYIKWGLQERPMRAGKWSAALCDHVNAHGAFHSKEIGYH